MAIWKVQAGKTGQRERFALENSCVVIGWEEFGDLSTIKTKEALLEHLKDVYSDKKLNTLKNWCNQIWAFYDTFEKGDIVALPLKSKSAVAFGEVIGDYVYKSDNPSDARHTRPVKWLKEIPRTQIDQDLLYSLGAFLTVCRIERNDAEARLRALIKGEKVSRPVLSSENEPSETDAALDIAQFARSQIHDFIQRHFKGHALARLVEEVLKAQGYKTFVSPEGADGGVDVLAGRGPMGFDAPRLCVQVKSSDNEADVKVLRELQGVMKNFGAEHGLLVSWGGFRGTVEKEARRTFFQIRLWDADALVEQVESCYDKFSEEIQAELPLKQIWAPVLDAGD